MNISNCDRFVISNLGENVCDEDVKEVLKDVMAEKQLLELSVHPTGSTSSKIIKDVDPGEITKITKLINNKVFKGRKLYCKPHVPMTPPKIRNKKKSKNLNSTENGKDERLAEFVFSDDDEVEESFEDSVESLEEEKSKKRSNELAELSPIDKNSAVKKGKPALTGNSN